MQSTRRLLTPQERLDWLRLTRSENVGPVTFHRLLERFGTATAALAALPDLARRGGRANPLRIPSKAEAERELTGLERMGGRMVASCEPDYPRALAAIDDAPPVLSLLGHPQLLKRPAVAIVGARNASIAGRNMAQKLGRELAAAGFLVVSGMARGIDTSAHQGALSDGTAAVVAGGADIVYPAENAGLHAELRHRGVIIAESALGTEPQARHFPRRNRLISGLSLGVLVVEAALKSGSLITARMANDQGREVLAIPGSPADPRAQGCNRLIKDGATLVESAEDVVEVLKRLTGQPFGERDRDLFSIAAMPSPAPVHGEADLEEARTLIAASLSPTPVLIDEVVRGCQLSAGVVRTVLLELELAGRVQIHPGGRVSLI
ncbi:DNA-processing protein DprA [Indioceanicola profundi]|uniref:DNA-processing protein DprA n=1 Tax=Indioceanicola profundi TaxID=2220096 RepID=UPI000E6AD9DF|nr:DNA-processing protein DprA [Indioceanicola profundi]